MQNFGIFESVVSTVNQIQIKNTDRIPELFEVDRDSPLFAWHNLIRLVTCICLLRHFPNQQSSISQILEVLVPQLCAHSSTNQSELLVFLDVFSRLISTLKQSAEFAFAPIWAFLSSHVLCTRAPPPFYHNLHPHTISSSLNLVGLMLRYFAGQRAFLFDALSRLLADNEHVSTFISRHSKTSEKNNVLSRRLLVNSKFSLESHVMGEFWRVINGNSQARVPASVSESAHGDSLCASGNITCGLVNLSATCYFNSLIQQFANMDWFVELVLGYCANSTNFDYVAKMGKGTLVNRR